MLCAELHFTYRGMRIVRKLICLVAFVATCGFGYQAYQHHNLASLLAFLVSLVALLTAMANLLNEQKKSASINQVIGKNSSGIQVGGNITINEKDKK
ncbi:TPA: hypothetical protein MI464_27460 [Klebsiella pneumoniae]|nr:hypothetical protein [Klebsiella variicola]HBY6517577.1 hypothetical protein [Klebsiella pneumoniae]HBY6528788.1 hypothetical protein [Klebsiella pneumoniae]